MARRSVSTSQDHAGVAVEYRKRERTITLSGWYDTMVGIKPERMSLATFLGQLGITLADCNKALAEYEQERRS